MDEIAREAEATLNYLLKRDEPIYIFTLDSHDQFGPFLDDIEAHCFAKERQLSSYQFVSFEELPQLTRERRESEEELESRARHYRTGETS